MLFMLYILHMLHILYTLYMLYMLYMLYTLLRCQGMIRLEFKDCLYNFLFSGEYRCIHQEFTNIYSAALQLSTG
ncbi:hypothetical protein D3C71_2146330 [compost metagenome]